MGVSGLTNQVGTPTSQLSSENSHLDPLATEKLHRHAKVVRKNLKLHVGRQKTGQLNRRGAGIEIKMVAPFEVTDRLAGNRQLLDRLLTVFLRKGNLVDKGGLKNTTAVGSGSKPPAFPSTPDHDGSSSWSPPARRPIRRPPPCRKWPDNRKSPADAFFDSTRLGPLLSPIDRHDCLK